MPAVEVAFLGPRGTYSHLVAEKRFGSRSRLIPLPTLRDVCQHVARSRDARGVVPIENSSGGAILETVDILLANKPRIHIEEELSLLVTLALIGRHNEKPKLLYSHFAPLEHCAPWIKKHLPKVEKKVVASTAVAALWSAAETGSVALGSRHLARMYGLDILHYPVEADTPNLTSFLVVSGRKRPIARAAKTTLSAKIPNTPGSLCTFLDQFRRHDVNLSRIVSRPIRGCPREYAFLVDIEGGTAEPKVLRALAGVRKVSTYLRVAGSYPCRAAYRS
jgi:prephenate dehydratase